MGPLFVKRKTSGIAKKRTNLNVHAESPQSDRGCSTNDAKEKDPKERNSDCREDVDRESRGEDGKPEAQETASKRSKIATDESLESMPKRSVSFSLSQSIKQSHAFDFQQDICKEYFQKGRCRYGDDCKFLHERRDSAARTLKNRLRKETETSHGCSSCHRDPPEHPVLPKCGHKLCEACFLEELKASSVSKCKVCDKELGASARPVPT